ncbi:MAG TPA: sensor domain-containing diguanylate cyclase [Vicinamibacterales bacterium]|nr:sensor domain-containing diguanylate cyclase [Vicinamibacterales bacterium]
MGQSDGDPLPSETYRALVEDSLIAVYLIRDERLVYVNRRFADLFGYSREEVLRLPSLYDLVAEDDRDLVREKLRQRIAGEITSIEYTIRGVRRDGQLLDLDIRSVRTVYDGGPAVMGTVIDITAQRRLADALRTLTLVDDLTGVYNRRGFSVLAERHLLLARRRRCQLLLVFADVDDLKQINDTYGHAAGDRVLMDAAAVLRTTYRSADIIARLGGDEFTAFPLEADVESADALVARLHRSVEQHNALTDRPYVLSLSVGVARFDPERLQTIEQLLAEADGQMYQRKRERAGRAGGQWTA